MKKLFIYYSRSENGDAVADALKGKVDIRKMPEISFVYDESIEYGKKIEDIIERIKHEG